MQINHANKLLDNLNSYPSYSFVLCTHERNNKPNMKRQPTAVYYFSAGTIHPAVGVKIKQL